MKVLTNRIGRQAGGINRRVHEMSKYINCYGENELVVVGLGASNESWTRKDRYVKEYWLPYCKWQEINPGEEAKGIPKYLKDVSEFERFFWETINLLGEVIENENPDLCCVQGAFYFPWCVILAASLKNIPIVQLYCGSTQTEVFDVELRQAYYSFEKLFAKLAKRTIFNSQKGKSFISELFSEPYSDSPVIYNGFPSEYARLHENTQTRVILGWCGRNVAVKNIDYLLRLRQFLSAEECPMYAITNLSDSGSRLKQFIDADIILLGQVSPEKMDSFYRKVSSVISTSYFEFFPNVMAETIAAGRVPIVPKDSGIAELLIANNLEKLVVDLADVDRVAQLIRDSNNVQAEVQRVGQRLMIENSWERVIEKYFSEFTKVTIL